jgi:CheY-like chemotaxis protein
VRESGERKGAGRGSDPRPTSERQALPPIVLIADDDATQRIVLQDALTRGGYLAIPVDDGGEIWPVLERENVRALLLDLRMQGVNGWEVLRRLREDPALQERRADLRVIVISAQSDPASRDFVATLGADAFLAKPLDLDAVIAAVRNAPP